MGEEAKTVLSKEKDSVDYNTDLEFLLKIHAEECESLSILHRLSYEKYNILSNYINIPVIILSSAIGFVTGVDLQYDKMNLILGIGSVFVGIIKSIDSYFQLSQRAESHRMCSLQFAQITKKIQIELALQRDQRVPAHDMLTIIKTDIKNLNDIAPLIDVDIIDVYNNKYDKYTNVKKPNFVNGLTEVIINGHISGPLNGKKNEETETSRRNSLAETYYKGNSKPGSKSGSKASSRGEPVEIKTNDKQELNNGAITQEEATNILKTAISNMLSGINTKNNNDDNNSNGLELQRYSATADIGYYPQSSRIASKDSRQPSTKHTPVASPRPVVSSKSTNISSTKYTPQQSLGPTPKQSKSQTPIESNKTTPTIKPLTISSSNINPQILYDSIRSNISLNLPELPNQNVIEDVTNAEVVDVELENIVLNVGEENQSTQEEEKKSNNGSSNNSIYEM